MDSRTKILDSMGSHAFWLHNSSEGMGATYLNHKFQHMDLNQWSNISARQVEIELEVRMERHHPDLSGDKLTDAVHRAKASLEQAIFINADKVIREKSSALMRQMAANMAQGACHPQRIKSTLEEIQKIEPGQERIAMLEAIGMEPEAARGLDTQMTMNSTEEIFQKLSENRLAMISRSPLSLDEVAQSMKNTASSLRTLARRLDVQRDINVFDLCPQIARGVMSQMKKDSIAYMAIDKRLQDHRMYKKVDQILGLTAGVLFQIGAMALGPAGEFANYLYNAASATYSIANGSNQLKLSQLSRVAGTMSQEDFSANRKSAYGDIVLGVSTAHTVYLPFGGTILGAYAAFEK